ncbi:hypothetical protein ACET3Z_023783 [Daucus carota]
MNSIVKVEFDNHDDQETTGGFIDNYSIYNGGSRIEEFDPMCEPWPLSGQHDDIPELSMKDIEEITRSLDADCSCLFHQPGNSTLVGATQPTVMASQPQIYNEPSPLVDANTKIETTQSHQYFHAQNMFVNAVSVYATITHHEAQDFPTHYRRADYETTNQPQYSNNYNVGNLGSSENVVYNSMHLKDDYCDIFPLQIDENVIVDAEPICMIPASANHVPQCHNVSAAHDSGNVKSAINLKSEQSSNVTAMVKYEEGVSLRQNARCKTSALELDEIRKHFNLPLTEAAKKLNVGPTVLKKRCRELNIKRWPHRKIKSLQCLINNIKEMGMTNKKEIEMLEESQRMLERVPELELSESAKRLRQSCFKANYKKRRLSRSSAAARR